MWVAILLTSAGAYLEKLAGLSVPARALDTPRVRRTSLLLPISLLAALTAVQVFADGRSLVLDARAAALGFAFVALLLRAPFLVVVVGAAAVAAGLRALAG